MKKLTVYGLLPVVLVAAASTASAHYDASCAFNGFYTGLGIGDSETVGSTRSNGSNSIGVPGVFSNTGSASARAGLRKSSVAGNIFAGYGSTWDCFYLGAEAYYKGAKSKTRHTESFSNTLNVPSITTVGGTFSGTSTTHAKLRNGEFGLDLRPGYLITPSTLFYGKVGVAFNRVSIRTTSTFSASGINFPSGASTSQSAHAKKNAGGLRLGAGLEKQFCSNWSIKADYTYTRFQRVSQANSGTSRFTSPIGAGTASVSRATSARLSNHTTMLGLTYFWQ